MFQGFSSAKSRVRSLTAGSEPFILTAMASLLGGTVWMFRERELMLAHFYRRRLKTPDSGGAGNLEDSRIGIHRSPARAHPEGGERILSGFPGSARFQRASDVPQHRTLRFFLTYAEPAEGDLANDQ